jgi:hypothetical protein
MPFRDYGERRVARGLFAQICERSRTRERSGRCLVPLRSRCPGRTALRRFNSRGSLFLDAKKFLADLHPRLLNCPERKRLALFQTRIPIVNQLQSTLMTGAHQRFVFPEFQGVEGASIFRQHNPDDDSMLILLLIDGKNFCWYACHSPSFNL